MLMVHADVNGYSTFAFPLHYIIAGFTIAANSTGHTQDIFESHCQKQWKLYRNGCFLSRWLPLPKML